MARPSLGVRVAYWLCAETTVNGTQGDCFLTVGLLIRPLKVTLILQLQRLAELYRTKNFASSVWHESCTWLSEF